MNLSSFACHGSRLVERDLKPSGDTGVLVQEVLEAICHRALNVCDELVGILLVASAATVDDFHVSLWIGLVARCLFFNFQEAFDGAHLIYKCFIIINYRAGRAFY